MENNEIVPNVQEQIEESFSQFLFLLFIPNSYTGYVEVYIDEGEHSAAFSIKEFLAKIEKICGRDEMNRISMACNNLGIPFFYDREKKTLRELKEKPKEDRMSVSTIKNLSGFGRPIQQAYSTDAIFNSVKGQYSKLINELTK